MDIVTGSKINQLLMNTDQNGLVFSAWLKTQDIPTNCRSSIAVRDGSHRYPKV